MFAKCYLRVTTGSDAAFTQWTSADITNLFLCALVVPMPVVSTSRIVEKKKMSHLSEVGKQAVAPPSFVSEAVSSVELIEEELHKLSNETIDQLNEAWRNAEILAALSRPALKDSSDKPRLIRRIKESVMRAIGYYV